MSRGVYVLFVLLICVVPYVSLNYLNIDGEVQEQCLHRCRQQNHTDVDNCDDPDGCNIKCEEGCKLWKSALNSSCPKVCNGTKIQILSPKELYCIMGCNDAITYYYTELRARLGDPPPPALVADSLTATSLRLEWNFPEASHAGLRYFLQWRYEEHAAAWQYCRNKSWGPQDTVTVDNLQPYTKYRFRVAVILSNMTEPIVSPPSVVISTKPAGVPASAPVILLAVPVDSTRISVSWEPGPFPRGPLLSYVLRITDNQPHGYSALKDVAADKTHIIFRDLSPSKKYSISISMRNEEGHGPAANISLATPPEIADKDVEKPVLILGAHHVVIEQGTDMLDEPVILYNTNEFITGLAIHVNKRLLFVSDSARNVHKMPLYKYTNHTKNTVILSPSQMNFIPLDLSMDWLNNHLYILGEITHQSKVWQIARCNLEGVGLTVAVAGLRMKPHHIEVDPYNGYLFWVTKVGIYRLDLADISNGIKHEIQPLLILPEGKLGAFTVDYIHFRLLVANQTNSTVNSVSFDGKEVSNMRPSITASRLQKVVSLAQANNIFYWTDGDEVLYEEYHPTHDSNYFHNQYPLQLSRSYIKVLVNLTSSQPIPVPLNPPTLVQAVFGTTLAKTSWQIPHLIGGQGKGAWQNWSYEISIKDRATKQERILRGINSTLHTIIDLRPDTFYTIKARGYTSFGRGSWSSEFIGRTLKTNKDLKEPLIIWSANEGLLKSDASGDSVETVLHKNLKNRYTFNDIAWYKDYLYLVTNTSQVYWYNVITHKHGIVSEIDSVDSIAVDWIGKKLYWSKLQQQLIIRGNFNGSQQEPLPILTLAKELNIDSVNGYLYWSTGYTMECAHLNGADKIVYHEDQYFSGKKVMGLTLDMDNQMVYWIVRGSDHSEGSNLFRAPMAGSKQFGSSPTAEKVARLQNENIKGALSYFNNRLIWLQDDKSAVISDMHGKYTASVSGKSFNGLNMMYVMDSAQHVLPTNGTKQIHVIPDVIDKNSIRVEGAWQSFNISWAPVVNVNYGVVFYEIKIDTSSNDSTILTTIPTIKYWKQVNPYTKLQVSIKASTYWGSSSQIRVKIHTPSSTPSEPKHPRAFVTHQNQPTKEQINVTFRWDSPEHSNGVLEGYKVFWWSTKHNVAINDSVIVDASEKEYVISGLKRDERYYLQVQGYTKIGDGKLSQKIEVNSTQESPIPTLLIASQNSIYIHDIDSKKNFSVIQGISTPTLVCYLLKERKVFWINDMQELRMYNLATANKSKIFDVNGKALSLTVDWLERSLFYIQRDDTKGSVLYKLDLNLVDKGIVKSVQIFRTPYVISKIEVSPFSKKLYWIESDLHKSNYRLKQSNTDGSNIAPFFSHSHNTQDTKKCNCPTHANVAKTFTLDHSKSQIIFMDATSHNLMTSNPNGCTCEILLNKTLIESSLPINSIQSDLDHIYWLNQSRNTLFSFTHNVLKTGHLNAHEIYIYGQHMQPYPDNECLTPKFNQNQSVTLKTKTSNTLTLQMPRLDNIKKCANVSIATIEYKIYYMPFGDGENLLKCDDMCTQEMTFDETIVIKNLRPYSKYLFSVALSNYYMDFNKKKLIIGPGVVFQTAAGAPSPPRDVQVTVLNPTLVKVSWLPPDELNGDFISYEIHWQTDGFVTGIRQKGEQKFMPQAEALALQDIQDNLAYINPTINNSYETYVKKLSPNETYSIWVRAYSQTNEIVDSNVVKIQTYPEPDNITLLEATAFKMVVGWNVSNFVEEFYLQYTLLTTNQWLNLTFNYANESKITIDDLKPKTPYKFRLRLKYIDYDQYYVWPKDSRFTFETQGDRPSTPGVPLIQHVVDHVYQVRWEASKENGALIELYNLETLKIPSYSRNKRSTNRTAWFPSAPSVEEPELSWESIYNGTETYWKIDGLTDEFRYSFRVSSFNAYGWSNLSEESDLISAAQLAENQDNMKYLSFAIAVPLTFVAVLVVLIKTCHYCCTTNKKHQQINYPQRGPDVELATLRELPRRGNFVHNTNVLYVATQAAGEELTLLPHIRRDQITLMKFLGSGAFGEVFEGKAKAVNGNDADTKVAVKTLRKGASDQEKLEFLQEAQLMSHFKHEHILQLLGVCLDNDPHFIIMELMQGGDLLTYLRSSRKGDTNTPTLNLLELLKMCVDVARGCRYLEEMHFVHRDLACRNCLVSSPDPDSRIVKIGDFGLARDIYKNDYYRKEGEGLLPVRWMAPESLVDGVFTCQSDVWAFGVLLWEIMTLGQQPYPARNNLEVLHYVRRGGRLGKPIDCPETLHSLMLTCWSYEPEKRPTFKYCLDTMERLHLQTAHMPMTGAHIGQYISTVPQHIDGISNQAYFQDENHNHSGTSWKSGASEEDTSRERTPFLQSTPTTIQKDLPQSPTASIPKYLELIYDSDCPALENDGYEVPRSEASFATKNQTPSVCSSNLECCDSFNKVVNELTSIENLLRTPNSASTHLGGYTNMNTEQVHKLS